MDLYTGDQVRRAERPVLEQGGGEVLMRQAAFGLAQEVLTVLRTRGRVSGACVVALVGVGNNGGDGLWALSFLARRGVQVTALAVDPARLHDGGLAALRSAGGRVLDGRGEASSLRFLVQGADVVIDAILGTGARDGFTWPAGLAGVESAREFSCALERSGGVVVACDLPSGVDAATGAVRDEVLPAAVTVTFGAVKTGLMLGRGAAVCGRIRCIDLGLGPHLPEPTAVSVGDQVLRAAFAAPGRQDHKYSRGVVGVVAGSAQYPGAAVLVAQAVLHSGVGMVRVSGPEQVRALVLNSAPEAVTEAEVPQDDRVRSWVVGPGLGADDDARERLRGVLKAATASGASLVLDASALELVTRADLESLRQAGCTVALTPHAGEYSRLLERLLPDTSIPDPQEDPVGSVVAAARALDAVVLLKGSPTVLAAPDGQVRLQGEGGPELATAGSGDTLAGLVGAALLRCGDELSGIDAAAAAVRLHGLAGRWCAARGPFGASALAEGARAVLESEVSAQEVPATGEPIRGVPARRAHDDQEGHRC